MLIQFNAVYCFDHSSPPLSPVADSPQQMVTRPVWVPDAVAKECMVCRTKFSTFVRKHHCRRCGRVVCSACSPHHVSLTAADSAPSGHAPSEHGKLERVCKECFKEMTAQHNRCELVGLTFSEGCNVVYYFPCVANSQSRPLRDSKVLLGSTSNSAVGGLPAVGQTTITKSPDHDSTDTEDSDDSSDEKEKQVGPFPPSPSSFPPSAPTPSPLLFLNMRMIVFMSPFPFLVSVRTIKSQFTFEEFVD